MTIGRKLHKRDCRIQRRSMHSVEVSSVQRHRTIRELLLTSGTPCSRKLLLAPTSRRKKRDPQMATNSSSHPYQAKRNRSERAVAKAQREIPIEEWDTLHKGLKLFILVTCERGSLGAHCLEPQNPNRPSEQNLPKLISLHGSWPYESWPKKRIIKVLSSN